MKSMSRPGMDKPAKRLTRECKFRVRVPIGAIFTTTICTESALVKIILFNCDRTCTSTIQCSSKNLVIHFNSFRLFPQKVLVVPVRQSATWTYLPGALCGKQHISLITIVPTAAAVLELGRFVQSPTAHTFE